MLPPASCTGLAPIAGALCVELLASLLQYPQKNRVKPLGGRTDEWEGCTPSKLRTAEVPVAGSLSVAPQQQEGRGEGQQRQQVLQQQERGVEGQQQQQQRQQQQQDTGSDGQQQQQQQQQQDVGSDGQQQQQQQQHDLGAEGQQGEGTTAAAAEAAMAAAAETAAARTAKTAGTPPEAVGALGEVPHMLRGNLTGRTRQNLLFAHTL